MATLSDIRLAEWLEQVADGLNSGIEPANAVALARALPRGVGERLQELLKNGVTWGEAIDTELREVSDAELAVLEASSMAGRLPDAMKRIAASRREAAKVKRRMRLAIAYPLFLIHFAALAFSITYLVSGDVSSFLVSIGMVIVPVWLVLISLYGFAKLWPEGAKGALRVVPVFSGYLRNREAAVLCEVLATCFEAGMDVRDSWSVAARATGSAKLIRLGDSILGELDAGRKASRGIEANGKALPKGFLQLYRSGEETGKLDSNLEAAALRYQTDANNKLVLASVIYPKLILVGVFGYIGYRIIAMVSNYYAELLKITA